LAKRKKWGNTTEIAPTDRADIPSHSGWSGEFVRAPRHSSRRDFVLVDPCRVDRIFVFLESGENAWLLILRRVLLSSALVHMLDGMVAVAAGKASAAARL